MLCSHLDAEIWMAGRTPRLHIGLQRGRNLVRVKLADIALLDAGSDEAHLGWAVHFVQHQPGVIAAQILFHVLAMPKQAVRAVLSWERGSLHTVGRLL